jgi:type IV secretion system protein VirB10
MSDGIPGERTVSEVRGDKKPIFTRKQALAGICLVTAGIIGFVFWHGPNHTPGDEPARQTEASIGQTVTYDPPKAPPAVTPPMAPVQRAAPPPSMPQPVPFTPPLQPAPLPAVQSVHPAAQKRDYPRVVSFGSGLAGSGEASGASGGTADRHGGDETHVAFKPAEIPGAKTGTIPDRSLMLMPGVFRCTLDTAIDSTLPGPILCHLPQDVLSPSGVVLMERGTKIIGDYKNNVSQGQGRLMTMAATAYTPAGVIVPLDGPMADGLGRSGVDGDVDNHTWRRFGGAVLLSLADSALGVAQASVSKGGNTALTFQSGDISSLAQEILRTTINIPPTITVPQGKEVQIWVRYPIDFSSSYRLVNR